MPSILFPILLACYEIVTYLSNDMYLPALPESAAAGIFYDGSLISLAYLIAGFSVLACLIKWNFFE